MSAEFSPLNTTCTNKSSISFNKPTVCGNIQNFIQIDTQICKEMDTKVFDLSCICDLDIKIDIKNVQLTGLHHQTKFERNRSANV